MLSVKYVLDKCDYALKVIPLPEEYVVYFVTALCTCCNHN